LPRSIWKPIETGGGSIMVRANNGPPFDYGELIVISRANMVGGAEQEVYLQLTHEAALELHFKLGALLGAGRL